MKRFESIRFILGMIIGLFIGPIIVGSMIILVVIYEFKEKLKREQRSEPNKIKDNI